MGSTAGIVGALLGWSAPSSTRQPPPATPKASPTPSPTANSGPRSPRHRPRPDPRARRPGCHRPVHPGRPPRGLARLGSVAAVAGVTVGLNLVPRRPGRQAARRGLGNRATAGPSGRAAAAPGRRRPSTSPWRPIQHPVRRRDLHPLRPSRGLEPALPTLAGMGRGPGRSRLGRGRPDPGVGGRGHHGDQDPDHHLPHRHHPMVDPDGHTGVPQGACNRRRHRWGALQRPPRPPVLDRPPVPPIKESRLGSRTTHEEHLRMVARTLPGKQFDVARELRARVAVALQREGLAPAGPVTEPDTGDG
jgi:hypothetical protein